MVKYEMVDLPHGFGNENPVYPGVFSDPQITDLGIMVEEGILSVGNSIIL